MLNIMENNKWYNDLKKSSLTPPGYVFGIAWSILYLFIAISFLFNKIYCFNCEENIFFMIQLFLNLIWTPVFFKFKMIKLSLFIILFIIYFTIRYINISKSISKILLIPYLLWLFIALYFNLYIVINN
jgi:tryptophan-rich sensory protein